MADDPVEVYKDELAVVIRAIAEAMMEFIPAERRMEAAFAVLKALEAE